MNAFPVLLFQCHLIARKNVLTIDGETLVVLSKELQSNIDNFYKNYILFEVRIQNPVVYNSVTNNQSTQCYQYVSCFSKIFSWGMPSVITDDLSRKSIKRIEYSFSLTKLYAQTCQQTN